MMKLKIFLMLFSLVLISSCRKKSSDDYEYYKKDLKDSVVFADTIQSATLPDTTIVVVDTIQETPAIKGVDLNDQFFLVVASYAVEEYAMAKKADLESQGLKPNVFMINEDGWYKLAVESYATYQEARSALEVLREKGGLFGNAVIVSKKSKS
jgi:cell division protein FtsN